MARLIIFDDTVRGVDLPDRAVIVGRSLKADIPIHDRLLSRKHCTLLREGSGYRFLDLKSANGSFVNGLRVEKADLEFDDVIEIGNTVMVLLESDTWERGEGLTKLRNPLKAQELVQRLKRHTQRDGDGANHGRGATKRSTVAAGRAGERVPFGGEAVDWSRDLVRDLKLTPELLEGFLTNKIASLLVRRTPELRECLSDAMERVLTPESFDGGFEQFRSLVREAIQTSLQDAGLMATPSGATETEVASAGDGDEPTPREDPRVPVARIETPARPPSGSEGGSP